MAEPFIGEVDLYGFNFTPQNWALCDGSLLSISTHQALFALLGTIYGGDGRTSFGLPDLRGKMAVSQWDPHNSRNGWVIGTQAGKETHIMNVSELAVHSHSADFIASGVATHSVNIKATTDAGDNASPSNSDFLAQVIPPTGGPDKPEKIYKRSPTAGSMVDLGALDVAATGGLTGTVVVKGSGSSKPFNLIQPTQVLNYCIATNGLFPSRT